VSEAVGAGDEPVPTRGRIGRVFGTRRFFALFNVQVISALGDWVGFFAITSLAASISSQPEAAIALVTAARVAPGLLLAPFIGVLVDRFDRKRLMVTADISRAAVFMLLPLVQTVPGLILASFVLEIFTMMWSPAKEATVPSVVPPEKLTTANSLSLIAAYATMPIAGPVQFGLKSLNDQLEGIGWLGFLSLNREIGDTQALAFYFNAFSFLFSAFILWRFVFRGLPSNAVAARRHAPDAPPVGPGLTTVEEVGDRNPLEEERSYLRRTWDEIREGWQFIYVNPVVRGVMIGLATGLMGGAMLVPLGPTFARFVIGNPNTFPLFITALGFGVATGVVVLSVLQRRIPREQAFPLLVTAAGVSMFVGVSMSSFWLAAAGVFGLGLCAGAVYVLGFTLLQEHTDDDLRGRIFTTLLTLVRLCVLLALVIGPFLATIFNGFARAATGTPEGEVPTMSFFGFDLAIPGVRLALWLAAIILMLAGVLAGRSMQLGLRSGIRQAIGANGREDARTNHPTSWPGDGAPGDSPVGEGPGDGPDDGTDGTDDAQGPER
jgi:MFS family permease